MALRSQEAWHTRAQWPKATSGCCVRRLESGQGSGCGQGHVWLWPFQEGAYDFWAFIALQYHFRHRVSFPVDQWMQFMTQTVSFLPPPSHPNFCPFQLCHPDLTTPDSTQYAPAASTHPSEPYIHLARTRQYTTRLSLLGAMWKRWGAGRGQCMRMEPFTPLTPFQFWSGRLICSVLTNVLGYCSLLRSEKMLSEYEASEELCSLLPTT